MTDDGAWNYYKGLDQKEAKVLETRADELNMACLYVRNYNNPKMLETLSTQFSLGSDKFPRTLEKCCSIHTTAFKLVKKDSPEGNNDDNAPAYEGRTEDGFLGAHLLMNNTPWEMMSDEDLHSFVGDDNLFC